MSFPHSQIRFLTIILLMVQLCLPVYGPDYFSEHLSAVGASHAGFVCDHAGADSDHESGNGNQQVAHCHELDAPCVVSSSLVLEHSPVISRLISSDKGALLDGYGAPFDIPPENPV
ncbi:MAG: hypothetical protein HY888_12190 [Deltaproteobacteria bacterium]|nr:hypothetical protein [Deltaproteobacteria bacterium]